MRGHEKCRVRPPWVDVEGVEPGPRLRDFGVDGNRWYVVHGGGVVGEWVVLVVVFMWLVGWLVVMKGERERTSAHVHLLVFLSVLLPGNKLVQMMNPWGKKRGEWTGDWSDESPKWTKRMKKKAGDFYKTGDDGIFILTAADFCKNFTSFYVNSEDNMIGYKKSLGLELEEGMKVVANGAFNRNSGTANKNIPMGAKGVIAKLGSTKDEYGVPKAAYVKFAVAGGSSRSVWSWPPSGDIMPDMTDAENKCKSIARDVRKKKIEEVGATKWKNMSWEKRYAKMSE